MNLGRSILAAAVGLILVANVGAPVRAEQAFQPAGAVTFKVDDVKKTITVTVKLAFYNRSCSAAASCDVSTADVTNIVKAIEGMWNTGHMVRCYTFSVMVKARTVGSQSEAGHDEIDVGLDYSPVPVAMITRGAHHVTTVANPLSNSPNDRVEAFHDPNAPTTWVARTWDQSYAHETGHILGLDDNYVNGGRSLYPGATEDLMFRNQGYVTDEMVKRVVERSGQVNLKDLKCGWTIANAVLFSRKGTKCGGLGGDWTVQDEQPLGLVSQTRLWNVTIDEKTLAGSYRYELIQTTPGSVGTGNASGKARIATNPDESVTMTLDPTVITLKVTSFGRTTTTQLPAQGLTFVWQPATGNQCP
jgi:hypothetical protein